MANNSHTVMICPDANRQDMNNIWRILKNPLGIPYDASPVNSLPGVQSIPLAASLNATTPWTTVPTHWMASSWELPTFAQLVADIKAGNITFTAQQLSQYNLTAQKAKAAGQALYSRTQDWDPNGTLQTYEVVQQNIAAALADTGLKLIPSQPRPGA